MVATTKDEEAMGNLPRIMVNREALTQRTFDRVHEARKPVKIGLSDRAETSVKSCFTARHCVGMVKNLFPIIDWLRNYDIKNDLVADLVCGITIAIFQVPQGMGYAMLAQVPPVYGLYTSFFPVLIYALMGTSRQASVGAFSLCSLMTGAIVMKWADFNKGLDETRANSSVPGNYSVLFGPDGGMLSIGGEHVRSNSEGHLDLSPIEVAIVVSLLSGVYQAAFGFLRLGYLAVYLSEHLVSGFTTGAAIHVATSQVQNIFGISNFPAHHGAMNQIYTYIDLFKHISETHMVTFAISATCMIILCIFKFGVNPWVAKYSRVPVPIELLLVIAGTVVSHFLNLQPDHGVDIVGDIQTGFPTPTAPAFWSMGKLAVESLAVAIVGFSSTVSLGKIFAQRYGYEIDANQELFALGSCNIFGSFFHCIPSAASISRSSVQDGAGGRTQLVSLINCAGLLVVLLSLGSLLEPLPNSILASIIVISLKGMIFQVKDFIKYWKVSKVDGLIWMVTFLSVLLIDVDIGLLVGVIFSLVTLVFRSQRPKVFLLGRVNDTDVYVPGDRYAKAKQHPGIKIFRFGGPLHFGNVEYFSNALEKATGISTSLAGEKKKIRSTLSSNTVEESVSDSKAVLDMATIDFPEHSESSTAKPENSSSASSDSLSSWDSDDGVTRHVILDCSSFSFVDNSGVTILKQVFQMLTKVNVRCSLAACPLSVFKTLEKGDFFVVVPYEYVFPTIQDAIICAQGSESIPTSPRERY